MLSTELPQLLHYMQNTVRDSRGLASHSFDILKTTCSAVICTRSGIDNQTHNSQEKIHNTSKHGQK